MKRGDNRRKRWNNACELEILQHTVLAVLFGFGIDGATGKILSGICIVMLIHSCLERKNGWKMSDKRPPWADRHDAIDVKLKHRLKRL